MSEIMTRHEAAEIVRTFREVVDTPLTEHREILLGALDMAIEALEIDLMMLNSAVSLQLKEAIERGEVYLAPAPKEATIPILIHNSGKTFDGYYDRARRLIFASSITEELAEQIGWTWEEAEEQNLGGE